MTIKSTVAIVVTTLAVNSAANYIMPRALASIPTVTKSLEQTFNPSASTLTIKTKDSTITVTGPTEKTKLFIKKARR